jgi:hypothetical protein
MKNTIEVTKKFYDHYNKLVREIRPDNSVIDTTNIYDTGRINTSESPTAIWWSLEKSISKNNSTGKESSFPKGIQNVEHDEFGNITKLYDEENDTYTEYKYDNSNADEFGGSIPICEVVYYYDKTDWADNKITVSETYYTLSKYDPEEFDTIKFTYTDNGMNPSSILTTITIPTNYKNNNYKVIETLTSFGGKDHTPKNIQTTEKYFMKANFEDIETLEIKDDKVVLELTDIEFKTYASFFHDKNILGYTRKNIDIIENGDTITSVDHVKYIYHETRTVCEIITNRNFIDESGMPDEEIHEYYPVNDNPIEEKYEYDPCLKNSIYESNFDNLVFLV